MNKEIYTFAGTCEYNELLKVLSGSLHITQLENSPNNWNIEGIILKNIHDKKSNLKGFINIEEKASDKCNIATIILMEYPIQKDAINMLYSAVRTIPKIKDLNPLRLNGSYIGKIYSNVKIGVPEESLLEGLTDISLAEFLFTELEYDESKGYHTILELEHLKK